MAKNYSSMPPFSHSNKAQTQRGATQVKGVHENPALPDIKSSRCGGGHSAVNARLIRTCRALLHQQSHLCSSSHTNAVASNLLAKPAREPARDSMPESFLKAEGGSKEAAGLPSPEGLCFDMNPAWLWGGDENNRWGGVYKHIYFDCTYLKGCLSDANFDANNNLTGYELPVPNLN